MVRHIVAWNLKEEFTEKEKQEYKDRMKTELENLKNIIDGMVSIQVFTEHLYSSESDILLDSVFVDEEALKAYQEHPEHVRVGQEVVRPFTYNRKCLDFTL